MPSVSSVTDTIQGLEKMLDLMLELSTTIVKVNNRLSTDEKHLRNDLAKIVYPAMQKIIGDQVLFSHIQDRLEKTEGVAFPVAPTPFEDESYYKELERLLREILRAKGESSL